MQIKSKALGITIGILLAVALLSVIGCAMAGLLMLGWNVVGVMALTIAVPITFLTALKGVGILYIILFLFNVIRTAIQAYSQKMQMMMAMRAMQSFGEELAKAEKGEDGGNPDLMRHFKF